MNATPNTKQTAHTPTPWVIAAHWTGDNEWEITSQGELGVDVCSSFGLNAKENLEFIVKACNAHDDLVAAATSALADLRAFCGVVARSHGVHSEKACAADKRYRDLRAALARVQS